MKNEHTEEVLMDDGQKRTSDIGSIERELAAINAQLGGMAKSADITRLESLIEVLQFKIENDVHRIAAEKAAKAIEIRHEVCMLNIREQIGAAIKSHEDSLHKRPSSPPSVDNGFFTTMTPAQRNAFWGMVMALGAAITALIKLNL